MKLLFDHNLSHKLAWRLADVFPDSSQTRLLGMAQSADTEIWDFAKINGFVVVTLDKDFSDLSLLRGHPPKVIWLRCGNSTVASVEELIRIHLPEIEGFSRSDEASLLEIWP